MTRRRVLETGGVLALGALLAGCTGGGTSGDTEAGSGSGSGNDEPSDGGSGNDESSDDGSGSSGESGSGQFDGWFSNVSNYDGVVDETGQSEVTVRVGVEGNNGSNGFGPAAVRVDSGTTVVWEWTGKGSSHNVVAQNADWGSDYQNSEGATFEHTFSEPGTHRYVCEPHKTMGMKGVVVVE